MFRDNETEPKIYKCKTSEQQIEAAGVENAARSVCFLSYGTLSAN